MLVCDYLSVSVNSWVSC